jgi:hypothetical protein
MAGTLRKIKARISRPAAASFPRRRESILRRNEAKACVPAFGIAPYAFPSSNSSSTDLSVGSP